MATWDTIYRLVTSDTDSDKRKNTISSPQENDLQGYSHTIGADNSMVVKDHSGNIVSDPNIVKRYQQGVTGGWAGKPYQGLTAKQAYYNPQLNSFINQQNESAYGQQNQRLIGRGLSSQDYDTLTPEQQALFPSKQNAITTTGGDFRGNNLIGQGTDLAEIKSGLPQITANASYNSALAQQQESANRVKQAAMSGLLGTPELTAGVENQSLGYQAGQLTGNSALQPQRFQNEGLSLSNQYRQGLGEAQRIPYLNSGQLADAQTGSLIANKRLGLTPYTTQQINNEAISGLIGSQYSPVQPQFGNRINPNGTVTPMTKDPYGANPEVLKIQSMSDAMGAFGGKPGAAPLPPTLSGTRDINPLGSPTPAPIGKVSGQESKQLTPIKGFEDYEHDEKGNLFHKGTPIKVESNSPLDSRAKEQIYMEKKAKEIKENNPHGLSFELGKTVGDSGRQIVAPIIPPFRYLGNSISKGYHKLIGE